MMETSDWTEEELEARLGYREPEVEGEPKTFQVN